MAIAIFGQANNYCGVREFLASQVVTTIENQRWSFQKSLIRRLGTRTRAIFALFSFAAIVGFNFFRFHLNVVKLVYGMYSM